MTTIIPPIKSQGIKTKLVPWISELAAHSGIATGARWIEPFFGTGVVGFNSPLGGRHIAADTNPHIINFYRAVQDGSITPGSMRQYLETEARLLAAAGEDGYEHYREVRNRFNHTHNPYDFIFLSRAGFNGLMRFNRGGGWNVPFCKKPERFAPAYITKICNQIERVREVLHRKEWLLSNAPFTDTISLAQEGDLIYLDPPYYGRYADYYNGWTEDDEAALYQALEKTKARFILSTWHHNEFRKNEMIDRYWGRFNIETAEHFYHGGAHIENRHGMTEALVYNFDRQERSIPGRVRVVRQDLFYAVGQ